ncbi:MAG: restriction endonuclease subunit S, partial [Oscillospiraceae bacterium]
MKFEWKTKTVGELTSYIAKGIPPKYTDEKSKTAIAVLNQKCNRDFNLSYEQSRLHDTALKKVPDDKMIKNGDVIINSTGTGTAGRIAQASDISIPTTIDGHMIIMRPTEEIDSLYYGYALKSNQPQIESFAEGSTGQTEINRHRLLNELTITYPTNVNLQHQIAVILSVIDKKIALNTEINENL